MTYDVDFAVFIGRFQPFHSGHLHVIQTGLAKAERMIILLGSSWQARSSRNPWTHQEREQMLRACLSQQDNERLLCLPLMDAPYNQETWVRSVQATVAGLVTAHHHTPHKSARIALIGHKKDASGFYLSLFPQWDNIDVSNHNGISATPIRERYFSEPTAPLLPELVNACVLPTASAQYLEHFSLENDAYQQIYEEIRFEQSYKSAWASAPYPPIFVTVDAVVIQSGHVLLIERRANPGKGLWALPGGFVNQDELLLDACLRELREETRLKVPAPVLKGSIKRQAVYDDPYRSSRGRTITHAFYMELQPNASLPKVKGADDAKTARWMPLAELEPRNLFEDHYFIIQDLLGNG